MLLLILLLFSSSINANIIVWNQEVETNLLTLNDTHFFYELDPLLKIRSNYFSIQKRPLVPLNIILGTGDSFISFHKGNTKLSISPHSNTDLSDHLESFILIEKVNNFSIKSILNKKGFFISAIGHEIMHELHIDSLDDSIAQKYINAVSFHTLIGGHSTSIISASSLVGFSEGLAEAFEILLRDFLEIQVLSIFNAEEVKVPFIHDFYRREKIRDQNYFFKGSSYTEDVHNNDLKEDNLSHDQILRSEGANASLIYNSLSCINRNSKFETVFKVLTKRNNIILLNFLDGLYEVANQKEDACLNSLIERVFEVDSYLDIEKEKHFNAAMEYL